MATSPMKLLSSQEDNVLSNIGCIACLSGGIKYLFFRMPNTAMQYNVDYNCGTLPEKYRPSYSISQNKIFGNSREYLITIETNGSVKIKCATNNLPSDGKPVIYAGITYC